MCTCINYNKLFSQPEHCTVNHLGIDKIIGLGGLGGGSQVSGSRQVIHIRCQSVSRRRSKGKFKKKKKKKWIKSNSPETPLAKLQSEFLLYNSQICIYLQFVSEVFWSVQVQHFPNYNSSLHHSHLSYCLSVNSPILVRLLRPVHHLAALLCTICLRLIGWPSWT